MIRMVIRFGPVVVLLISIVVQPVWALDSPAASPLPHDPIWILRDSGFTAANGVVSGSGTAEDPYIIKGWDVSVSQSAVFFTQGAQAGILVENTQAHFVIRNVFVHDGPTSSSNVVLKNVTNGRVQDSRIFNGNIGILISRLSSDNAVAGNEIIGFGIGVELSRTSRNLVEGNWIKDTARPIFTLWSSHNRFVGNMIEGRQGTAGAGVSMTRNSSFNLFEGNRIAMSGFGVEAALDSHFNLIVGNIISHVDDHAIGVGLGSVGNIIEGNTIVDSGLGVLLNQAFETTVSSNLISAFVRTSPPGNERFTGKGVWVFESSHNWVTGNTIVAPVGIALCRSMATFLAPPPNDLSGSERGVVAGPRACP